MESINYGQEGLVFDIQRYSIHDGPGIRTIVFLSGCPLSCEWCSNPESQTLNFVIMYQKKDCVHCGRCISVCKRGAIHPNNEGFIDRAKCSGCGECVNACPTGALVLKGKRMTVAQVIKELKKDAITYRRSGGGITLSGGEPLLQSDFSRELLRACKAQGWHTAIESTGFATEDAIKKVFTFVDLGLIDIKNIDAEKHKRHTGVSNESILKNIKIIAQMTKVVIRVPVIPGFNSSIEEILAIARYAKEVSGVDTLHLLPYHTYGENKYELLGRDYRMKAVKSLMASEMEKLQEIVESQDLKCIIGG